MKELSHFINFSSFAIAFFVSFLFKGLQGHCFTEVFNFLLIICLPSCVYCLVLLLRMYFVLGVMSDGLPVLFHLIFTAVPKGE